MIQAGKAELNVAAFQAQCFAAGPGVRSVLWLQGCPLRCSGCLNPEYQPFVRRTVFSVDRLAKKVLRVSGIKGVTYTGGEPMAQAPGLALLSERLRPAGLTVVCYTGYTLEALRSTADPCIHRLLRSTDILIDGPYLRDKAANLLWRGSGNQRVHFLTDAYRHLSSQVPEAGAQVEFTVGLTTLTTTGIWPEGLVERLMMRIRE